MKKEDINSYLPTTEQIEKALHSEKYRIKYKSMLRSTVSVLIIVFSISAIVATLIFSVLHIYGNSMYPNLKEEDIVISLKQSEYERGDIIAFYYNNKILVKRVIATASEWVEIDINGNVYVDKNLLEEPYLEEKVLGESDIVYPYQVPENSYFVLGDERDSSVDSRNSLIGCVSKEDVVGKILFRIWPLNNLIKNIKLGGN